MPGDSPPPTSFDDIELHKENIQPLASGRSARALAQVLSARASPVVLRGENAVKQAEFEQELKTASELDDPLEVWVRYVNWTVETFPSGSSHESNLIHLLERVTREFVREDQYKNDPRYLKLWIQYIQNFSDTPREAFAYLARHDIGQKLALFYEEFAALLESIGRRHQAAEVYQTGIQQNARPVERLLRKNDEFRQRLETNPITDDEPHSPALVASRPALAVKAFGGGGLGGLGSAEDPQQQQPAPAPAKKPGKMKMAIYTDTNEDLPKAGAKKVTGGWEEIGTRDQRKKENTMESRPFSGQTIKQEGGKKPSSEGGKLSVFRDTSLLHSKENVFPPASSNKRPEKVAVNLELVYPEEGEDEYSFEELRAIKRGLYGIDWKTRRQEEEYERRAKIQAKSRMVEEKRAPVTVKTVLSPSPNKGKIKRKGNSRNAEPTMTFHTRAATDEIYDIFNQPLQFPAGKDDEDSENDSDDFDGEDYTMATNIGDQTEQFDPEAEDDDGKSVKSDWSDFTLRRNVLAEDEMEGIEETITQESILPAKGKPEKLTIHKDERFDIFGSGEDKLGILRDELKQETAATRIPLQKIKAPPPLEDFDPPQHQYYAGSQAHPQNRLPYMTPIVERTESLPPTTIARRKAEHHKTPSKSRMPDIMDSSFSSPFSDDILSNSNFRVSNLSLIDPPLVQKERERKPFGAKPAAALKSIASKDVPIIQDLQCNPMDEALRAQIYEKLQPPLKAHEGLYHQPTAKFGKAAEIRRFSKSLGKKDNDRSNSGQGPTIEFVTRDGVSSYTIKRELGKGAFAPVYLAQNDMVADAEEEAEDLDEDDVEGRLELSKRIAGRKRFEAVKMEHPPSLWEFYIMRQAKRRLGVARASESILNVYEMHLFADEGYLILEYRDQGTILDLINIAKSDSTSGSGVMDETLVMFLAVELLRTVEALHTRGILHGDLKADNCLIRFDPISDSVWSARYRRDGADGWDKKGVSLIDFGRGIDMKLFSPNVQFIADWKTDQQDCAEMREMRPWTYQVDYYGLAAIIHTMLFGKYIESTAEKGGIGAKKYRITSAMKRYWQQNIWSELFDVLLNPLLHAGAEDKGAMPVTKAIRKCRDGMETWLENNCEKGPGLRNTIKRMEAMLSKRR